MLGSWPLDLQDDDKAGFADYAKRIWQWQQKALREAKLQSSWSAPNEAYENAAQAFTEKLLTGEEGELLRAALSKTVNSIAAAGALNGLAQTLLRMTVPGVPDLYQGNEYWDFSLVDPDNRRPVDYAAREQALQASVPGTELLKDWRDGRIKQALISEVLNLRKEHSELFRRGDYQPLEVLGSQAHNVLAFAREHDGVRAIVVVPVRCATLLENSAMPQVDALRWGDTRVVLPSAASDANLKGLFASSVVTQNRELNVSEALGDVPVNLFIQHLTQA